MRTSVKWINDYLASPASAAEQAEAFTAVGFPCESGEDLPSGDRWQEVETTSNRGDCLCHLGLARELAAATKRTVKVPSSTAPRGSTSVDTAVTVTNHDHARCPLYTARVIRGVTVGPSPEWLRERLLAIGQIPRNNVVDCSNFVLFELGQPTHAFDLARLDGATIQVRAATKGESFTPLGESAKTIRLSGGELVIADASKPVALAGVKGGADTAVHEGTRDLLIEAAVFQPLAVRTTSRLHQIASDSSYRFERGVAAGEVADAAERLVALILETAGGTALAGSISVGAPVPPLRRVTLRMAKLHAVAGFELSADESVRALRALGITAEVRGGTMECAIPARRLDLTREIDLIEEIVRLAGLDRVEVRSTLSVRPVASPPNVVAARATRDRLAGAGFVETVTHTLVAEREAAPFTASGRACLRTEDARSVGAPFLRPSLLPSLLATLKLNADRSADAPMLFEMGATFWLEGGAHHERRTLALVVAQAKDAEVAFRMARGSIDSVIATLRGPQARVVVGTSATTVCVNATAGLHPFGALTVDAEEVGTIGLVRKEVAAQFGLDGFVAACECDWIALSRDFPPVPTLASLATSPALDRDLSVVVDDACHWTQIEAAIHAARLPYLQRVGFVGTWRGKGIPKGRKSVTLRLVFRAEGRTLRRDEVDPELARATARLADELKAELRA